MQLITKTRSNSVSRLERSNEMEKCKFTLTFCKAANHPVDPWNVINTSNQSYQEVELLSSSFRFNRQTPIVQFLYSSFRIRALNTESLWILFSTRKRCSGLLKQRANQTDTTDSYSFVMTIELIVYEKLSSLKYSSDFGHLKFPGRNAAAIHWIIPGEGFEMPKRWAKLRARKGAVFGW